MGDPSPRLRETGGAAANAARVPLTPLRLPSSAAAAACRLSDSGREHGFGAPRMPALRFVRTAGGDPLRPRLQRHAPRLDVIEYRGVPRSPRDPRGPARQPPRRLPRLSPHRIRCGPSCLRRGVCPQDIAMIAIVALDCAFSSAHVGVSRPRCPWQLVDGGTIPRRHESLTTNLLSKPLAATGPKADFAACHYPLSAFRTRNACRVVTGVMRVGPHPSPFMLPENHLAPNSSVVRVPPGLSGRNRVEPQVHSTRSSISPTSTRRSG